MKYLMVSIMILGLMSTCLTGGEATRHMEEIFKVTPETILNVDHRHGELSVILSTERDVVKCYAEITVRARSQKKAESIIEKIKIIPQEKENSLILRTDAGLSTDRLYFIINMRLEVPENMYCILKNNFGNTEYRNIGGRLTVISRNGRVTVNGSTETDISVNFGFLELGNIQGNCVVMSANTNMNFNNLMGEKNTITSRFGSLNGKNMPGELSVDYANGNIKLESIGSLHVSGNFGMLTIHDCNGPAHIKVRNGNVNLADISGNTDLDITFGSAVGENIKGDLKVNGANSGLTFSNIQGRANIDNRFGDIVINQVGGNARLVNNNGSINAIGIKKELTAETTFADIEVEDIGSRVTALARNGSISVFNTDGPITATTAFGSIELADISPVFRAETSNGNINVRQIRLGEPTMILINHFGDIKCRLPESFSAKVTARTSFGKIRQPKNWKVSELTIKESISKMSAIAGDGKGTVELETSNGNIILE